MKEEQKIFPVRLFVLPNHLFVLLKVLFPAIKICKLHKQLLVVVENNYSLLNDDQEKDIYRVFF
jgi:hypothetical protein